MSSSDPAHNSGAVLLLEDNPETQKWIEGTLRTGFPKVRIDVAQSCEAALALLAAKGADYAFALIDLDLPDGDGTVVIRHITAGYPNCTPVVLSIFDDDGWLFAALTAGARGYILKGVLPQNLLEQFRRMFAGEPPISPRIARRIIDHFNAAEIVPPPCPADTASEGAPVLTAREAEILSLLGKGLSTNEISAHLGISPNTANTHIRAIYRKLGISNRAEAALAADRRGLI